MGESSWVIESEPGEDHGELVMRELASFRESGTKLDKRKCVFTVVGQDGKTRTILHKLDCLRLEESAEKEAEELRLKGNECYRKRDYEGALSFYSRSVEKCLEPVEDGGWQLRAHSLLPTLLSAQSNKVEALIQLGYISRAFHEAEMALNFDPTHVKTLCRKARALQKRQLHELARECLVKALDASPGNAEVVAELTKAEILCDQQKNGSHDVPRFVLGLDGLEPEPEFADYVGPVEIKMTEDGKGRGVFVTRDVGAGELLLASNAVVYNVVGARYDLRSCVNQLKLAAQDSFTLMRCLTSLAEKKRKDVPLDFFQPSAGLAMLELSSEYEVDMVFLNKVYSDNSCRVHRSGNSKQCEGLWILPSFINHSCCPNTTQHLLGRVAFNIAAVPIPAGGEVLCSYFDTLVPWNPSRREESLRLGKFECKCERCSLEKKMEKRLSQLSKTFEVYHSRDFDGWTAAEKRRVRAGYSRIVKELELHISGNSMSEAEKQWIRAAYVDAYFHQSEVEFEPSKLARAVRVACPTDIMVLCKIYHYADECDTEDVDEVLETIEDACFSLFGNLANQCMQALVDRFIRGS